MPFINKSPLLTRSLDGRNFVLAEALYCRDDDGTIYAVPEGSLSDGVSTPPVLWPSDPPFGVDRWYGGILHDASPAYRCTMLFWNVDHWSIPTLDFTACNNLLRRALISQGMSQERADIYFAALEAAGIVASVNDLAQPIGPLVMPPPPPAPG